MKLESAIAELPCQVRAELPFPRALSAGDLDSAASCFARDGCLITPDATAVHGRDRIRPLLAQLIARQIEVTVELSNVVGGGDVIFSRERWKIETGAQGAQFAQTIHPTLILRRIDWEWKLAIAAPWGWADGHL